LTATAGDQTITLWDQQVVGDLGTMVDWETPLDPLLLAGEDEPVDEDLEDGDTDEGEEDDEGSADDQGDGDAATDLDDDSA
jgi:hypothetical protein